MRLRKKVALITVGLRVEWNVSGGNSIIWSSGHNRPTPSTDNTTGMRSVFDQRPAASAPTV